MKCAYGDDSEANLEHTQYNEKLRSLYNRSPPKARSRMGFGALTLDAIYELSLHAKHKLLATVRQAANKKVLEKKKHDVRKRYQRPHTASHMRLPAQGRSSTSNGFLIVEPGSWRANAAS